MDCPFLSPSNTDTRATPTPLPCPPLPRRTVPAGRPREPESGRRWLPSGVLYSPALPLSPSPSALMLVAASALLATPRVSPTEPGGAGMHVYVPSTRTHSDRPSLQSASPPTVAGTVLPCMVRGASPEDHPHFAPDKYGSSPHPRYLLWRRGGRDARKGGVAAAPALLHLVPSPGPSPSRLAHAPATVSPPPLTVPLLLAFGAATPPTRKAQSRFGDARTSQVVRARCLLLVASWSRTLLVRPTAGRQTVPLGAVGGR